MKKQNYGNISNYLQANQSIILLAMNPDRLMMLEKCNINCFKEKKKGVISSGECEILTTPETVNFKGKSNSVEIKKSSKLVRLREISYISFLFLHENGSIYSISLSSKDERIRNFEMIMEEYVQIVDYFTIPIGEDLRMKIDINCPVDKKDQIGSNNDDQLNEIGQGIGNIFGGLSSLIPTDKMNQDTQSGMNRVSKDLGEDNMSKWQKFKMKVSNINDKVSEKIKPVSNKCGEYVSDIGKKFDSSDNAFIKGLRDFSVKTEQSLNQGYKKGEEPRRASYAQQQTKKEEEPPGDNLVDRKSML